MVVVAATLAPPVGAQQPYILYTPSPVSQQRPLRTSISINSTLSVPDGGTASRGSYSTSSMGRNEQGVPVLGKVPYLGRGFRNISYGRSVNSSRVSVRVRVIDLYEEEYRQTGFRSR
jgi:general secretion pathway protein D